jgi:hypothetical protein
MGTIVGAAITALASGGAAFLGLRTVNRSTRVTDEWAKETAEWDRIQNMVKLACSDNKKEAVVGMQLLLKSKGTRTPSPSSSPTACPRPRTTEK